MHASRFPLIDTDPHPRLPVYSASNFAEVAPERLSILSWSLVGEPTERATRALAARLWPRKSWYSGSRYVFVAYFACRPYHNLSAYVRLGSDLLGVDAQDVTASYFESTPHDDIPVRTPSIPRRVAVAPRMVREIAGLRHRAMGLAGEVDALEGMVGTLERDVASVAVGRAYERAAEVVRAAWTGHIAATASLVPLRSALRRAGRRCDSSWDESEGWVVRPREIVWEQYAGGHEPGLRGAEFLLHPFYELLPQHAPWSTYARTNAMPVAPLVASSIVDEHIRAFWGILGRSRAALLKPLVTVVADAMATRELTKSLTMRALHATRRLLPHLALAHELQDRWLPYLRYGELDGSIARIELIHLAEQRSRECEQALGQSMPNRLNFATEVDYDLDTIVPGRGVSPGRVVGFVVRSSSEIDPTRKNIFVVEAADADIQPVLPRVQGLLARRGSELSHIAILAREQGVPAVVGHALAETLRAGEQIMLDGRTGEVQTVAP